MSLMNDAIARAAAKSADRGTLFEVCYAFGVWYARNTWIKGVGVTVIGGAL